MKDGFHTISIKLSERPKPEEPQVPIAEETLDVDQELDELVQFFKANRRVFRHSAIILGSAFVVGTTVAVSLITAGIMLTEPATAYLSIPSIEDMTSFLNLPNDSAGEAAAMIGHVQRYAGEPTGKGAVLTDGSGRILLDILVLGCIGGILSAVLSAAGQKNLAMLIGFVTTMIIILKVIDLVNSVINKIAHFLGF